ncbi:MAG: hypothetical protein C5B50_19450 [Verrucomicrobia bacterium]|nr:MAG: hypothetical protein C5B50_19450 [Verrucomicrobiota bacterium]
MAERQAGRRAVNDLTQRRKDAKAQASAVIGLAQWPISGTRIALKQGMKCRSVVCFSAAVVAAFLAGWICFARSSREVSAKAEGKDQFFALHELESFVGYLREGGQTNTLDRFDQCANSFIASEHIADLGLTLAVLQKLRDGRTNDAVDMLEMQLSSHLTSLASSYRALPESVRQNISLVPVEHARDYRTKFPFHHEYSPDLDQDDAQALKILQQRSLKSVRPTSEYDDFEIADASRFSVGMIAQRRVDCRAFGRNIAVCGELRVPLGTVVQIEATIVSGSSLGKSLQDAYLLKVNKVASNSLSHPPTCEFRTHSWGEVKLARDWFSLYELKKGRKAESIDSSQMPELERDYVGQTYRLLVYEEGEFSGLPPDLPTNYPPWQDGPFRFQTHLVVLRIVEGLGHLEASHVASAAQ